MTVSGHSAIKAYIQPKSVFHPSMIFFLWM